MIVFQVNTTSAAVNGSPECQVTPCRRVMTQWRPSGDIVWPAASDGTSVLSCHDLYS